MLCFTIFYRIILFSNFYVCVLFLGSTHPGVVSSVHSTRSLFHNLNVL